MPIKSDRQMQAGWKIILIFSLLLQMLTFSQLGLVTAIVCVQDLFYFFILVTTCRLRDGEWRIRFESCLFI